MQKFFMRGKLEDVEQRRRFLSRLHPKIIKFCVMKDYANKDELLVIALEVEIIFAKIERLHMNY